MQTAQGTYEFRRKQVVGQIARLQEQLARLDEEQSQSPKDWSIVGSLGEVHNQLANLLDFIILISSKAV